MEPDLESVSRTRKALLVSVWVAVLIAVGAAYAVATRATERDKPTNDEHESLAVRLARENDAHTRDMIRSAFVDSIDAARAIQKNQGQEVTESQRGAFLRATEELFTLERTYGRERMMQEIGSSYVMAVRKLQAMLQ